MPPDGRMVRRSRTDDVNKVTPSRKQASSCLIMTFEPKIERGQPLHLRDTLMTKSEHVQRRQGTRAATAVVEGPIDT